MRTTVDLPDDLHDIAMAIARDTGQTLSGAVATLIRRGLGSGQARVVGTDPLTGLLVVDIGRVVTSEDVKALEDDELGDLDAEPRRDASA